jgi:hypothetical protein
MAALFYLSTVKMGHRAGITEGRNRMSDTHFHSNFEICLDLKFGEKCIVLQRYSRDCHKRLVHEHVPSKRLSKNITINLLKSLVIGSVRRSDDEIASIVGYFVNDRGRKPARRVLPITCEYPEPGVLRTYCGTNIMAWCDEVVSKGDFRQS